MKSNDQVISRILTLLEAQGKTQSDLTSYLKITPNAFTDWKSGRLKSYTKHLPKIAAFFGVTVDYLLGNDDAPIPQEPNLIITAPNAEEMQLLEAYRRLNEIGKKRVQDTVDDLMQIQKYTEKSSL